MEAPPIIAATPPPLPAEAPPPTAPPSVAKWRRWVMLLVLLGYVGAIGAMAYKYRDIDSGPVLPSSTAMLLKVAGGEIGMFAVLFAVVAWLARPSFKELFMTRWDGFLTLGLSVVWSVVVRILAIPAVSLYGAALYLWRHLNHGAAVTQSELRPQFEQLLPPEALQDPWYVIVAATVLSFGLGGFREELWRAGVLASFNSLLPDRWKNTRNGWAAGILLASVVFGSAHITQGVVGVVMTGMVGLGLGTIMVWRRSYWEAALAHGIFDATSIVTLWAVQRYFPEELKQMMVQ